MRARVSPKSSVPRAGLSPTARITHEIILISKSLPVVCDRKAGMNESRNAKRKHPRTVPANAGKDHMAGGPPAQSSDGLLQISIDAAPKGHGGKPMSRSTRPRSSAGGL